MTRVNGARWTEATLTLTLSSSRAYPPERVAFQVKRKAMAGNPEFMFLFNRQL